MIAFVGILIMAAGWLMMLGGVGVGSVANLHLLSIAQCLIITGGFVTLCGVIKTGFNQLASRGGLPLQTAMPSAPAGGAPGFDPMLLKRAVDEAARNRRS
jgi:hypothetical protein